MTAPSHLSGGELRDARETLMGSDEKMGKEQPTVRAEQTLQVGTTAGMCWKEDSGLHGCLPEAVMGGGEGGRTAGERCLGTTLWGKHWLPSTFSSGWRGWRYEMGRDLKAVVTCRDRDAGQSPAPSPPTPSPSSRAGAAGRLSGGLGELGRPCSQTAFSGSLALPSAS